MVTLDAQDVQLQSFDPLAAGGDDWGALAEILNRLQAERLPEDPQRTPAQIKARLSNLPPFVDARFWTARSPEHNRVVGYGAVLMFRTEENKHLAQLELGVLPNWRRLGIATGLLELIALTAHAEHKRLFITDVYSAVPAGAAFMARIGGRLGIESHINQLDLAELDRGLLRSWIARAEGRNPGFELGLWEGRYPEAELEAIVKLRETTNTQPLGDLEVEDFHWTAEHLRQQEQSLEQQGGERWTMYIRDTKNGELAGFTEVFWRPDKPAYVEQGFTAVWQHYRNHGLGRWLKAAMLDKMLRERSQVRYVRTDNADSNAPMLKINQELGFKPHAAAGTWQVELDKVREYLAGRGH